MEGEPSALRCSCLPSRAAAAFPGLTCRPRGLPWMPGCRIMLDVFGQMGYGYDFNARAMGHNDLMEAIPPLLSEFTLR